MIIQSAGLFEGLEGDSRLSTVHELSNQYYYLVGVYWWKDASYGGMNRLETMEEAQSAAEILFKLGYHKMGVSEVRIVKVGKQVWLVKPIHEEES